MTCPFCQSTSVIRFGFTSTKNPRHRCTACQRTFCERRDARKHPDSLKEQALKAYQERASMRGVCRIFEISRNTLSAWLREKNSESATV